MNSADKYSSNEKEEGDIPQHRGVNSRDGGAKGVWRVNPRVGKSGE
jgi:hypothetical protein